MPSTGIGLKLRLNKTLSVKIGLSAWTSPLGEDDPTVDYAGRAGISWIFL